MKAKPIVPAVARERISLEEFHGRVRAQGAKRREDVAFVCVSCGTLQSAQTLIDAGAGQTFEDVEKYLGFSCAGRFKAGVGCDWTLGGLFRIHTLEVETPDGEIRPTFRLASSAEASALTSERDLR